jgi:hypothetical protein
MQLYYRNALILLKQLAAVMGIYTALRILFLVFNFSYFINVPASSLVADLFYGLRFDLSALSILNSVYVILVLLPLAVRIKTSRLYQGIQRAFFIIPNLVALIPAFADFEYFKFTKKRTTFDVFHLVEKKSDFLDLLPTFIKDYWYVFALYIFIPILFFRIYRWINAGESKGKVSAKQYGLQTLILVCTLGSFLIAFRGGLQLKAITIVNAGEYGGANETPLITNTPFCIIKTIDVEALPALEYFPGDEARKICKAEYLPSGKPFTKKNVVIILLESFSKEFTGLSGKTSFTPFLDSLMKQSITYVNGVSNGQKSSEGVPSIIAGIPTIMHEAYVTSNYSTNRIETFGTLLKDQGYTTAFFHGGTNGTMNFYAFSKIAGFND